MNKNITSIIFGLAIVIGMAIIANAYKYKFKGNEIIVVTGLAEKDFESDMITWNAKYLRKSIDLKMAYTQLKEDEKVVKDYLLAKGLKEKEFVFSAVDVQRLNDEKFDVNGRLVGSVFAGYSLTQSINVESKQLEIVESTSRQITDLIEKGIELNSAAPSYYYSKLSELKIDLLAKAAADAKTRAETVAKSAGGGLGKLKKANMGVFQITGKNQNETYENGGTFNTSSKIKTASITVKTDYEL